MTRTKPMNSITRWEFASKLDKYVQKSNSFEMYFHNFSAKYMIKTLNSKYKKVFSSYHG